MPRFCRFVVLLPILLLIPLTAYSLIVPGSYTGHTFDNSTLVIETDACDVRIAFVRSDIARIDLVLADSGTFDSSLAVVTGNSAAISANLETSDSTLMFSSGELTIVATKEPVRLSFYFNGLLLTREPDNNGITAFSNYRYASWEVDPTESFYGTGEHNPAFDLSGYEIENKNKQNYGYYGRMTEMNISVPVLMSSSNWGVFIDNPRFGEWDIKSALSNRIDYKVTDGEMRYYFFAGDEMPDLVEAYTWLTGRQPMPPLWSLGFIQSKFGYDNDYATRLVASELRENQIPSDCIILDLYWFNQMGDFDWTLDRFPDPAGLVNDLLSDGFRTILINEPYICESSTNYSAVTDLVGKTADGWPYNLYDFWLNPPAYLLDMSDPSAREWYIPKAVAQLEYGIGGLWTDLGEPENHPEEMVHYGGTQNDVHNSFNLNWANAVADAFEHQRPDERIVNLTRSGSAGIQRYGVFTWSGDVSTNWVTFEGQPCFSLQMGLSGLAYHSSDLGGFTGAEDAELYTRWLAQGALSPVMRAHGAKTNTEPYKFGENYTAWNRQIVELRYRLLPYIYTMARENYETGMPLVRPLFFEDPDDPRFRNEDGAYMFGDRLLVAPVTEASSDGRYVPLPNGYWVDFWSDDLHAGGGSAYVSSPLGTIPLLVKAGSLLPMATVQQHTGGYPVDTLIVHSYPTDNGMDEFVLYEDDGISNDYVLGSYTTLPLDAEWTETSHTLSIGPRSGSFDEMVAERTFLADVHRVHAAPSSVSLNESILTEASSLETLRSTTEGYYYDSDSQNLWVQLSSNMNQTETISIDGFVSGISELDAVPNRFDVSKIYPNPFNSTAKFSITLPERDFVAIEVFDVIGRKVRTLANRQMEAGTHGFSFEASSLSSGIYFLRVKAAGTSVQRKMTLIK